MLTFEEFFLKKKIDLLQLASAEPDLFAEFSLHYPLMGEKSFDHTKKYWFNKLRRTYPLSTAIKPHPVKAENISKMAVQGMAAAAAQNLDPHLQKPKFTEDHLAELVGKDVSLKEVSLAEEEKEIVEKSGEMKSGEREQVLATEPAKPAFKPRFNMQNIKKTPIKTALEESKEKGEDVKSGEQEQEPATDN